MPTNHRQLLAQADQLLRAGRADAAEPLFRQVIAARPREADALFGLAVICVRTGRSAEAVERLQALLALKPYMVDALQLLASAYQGTGQHAEAAAALQQALTLKPDSADLQFSLATLYRQQQRPDDALAAYQRTLELDPQHVNALAMRGELLASLGRLDDAEASLRQAMALKPDYAYPIGALAGVLRELGRGEESLPLFRRYLQSVPTDFRAHSGLLFAMEYLPSSSPQMVFDEHVRWAQCHAPAPAKPALFTNDRSPERRLRIGYVSQDFRAHPVSYFFEGLLAHHDRSQVETFCYFYGHQPDATTQRLRSMAGQWREVAALSNAELVDLIRRDQIDILVDLAGHTVGNRLAVFAQKPAPVQVSYLGYIDTTGLRQMDYRLTDAFADPPGMTDSLHTETLVRLPGTLAVYRPPEEAPAVGPLPALANGCITFGCLNAFPKTNEALLRDWGRLLARVPRSRMVFASTGVGNRSVQERITALFAEAGVASERLAFHSRLSIGDFLSLHQRVDINLDTFPVNGHTITCHALWMGVPTVSQAGSKYVSRLGASVLHHMGMTELLAGTREDYLAIAEGLANDLPRLAQMRGSLRARMQGSPLMAYDRFARDVEAAYRAMWHRADPIAQGAG